jgi:DegV family protein with EDD domain
LKDKIALLTDSACDLPPEVIKEYSIHVLPLKIIYGTEEYSDRVDIQPEEVYAQMPDRIPTTAMPGLGEIREVLERIKNQGFNKVMAIHLSAGLSGTHDAVKMIAQEFKDLHIEVFDSKVLGMALGFQVWEAARDIRKGLDFGQVLENVRQLRPKINIYYVLETLEYLRRGGRIGRVEAVLGDLLGLKPIISCDDEGKYYTPFKARGRAKSINKLAELVERAVENGAVKLAVVHGGAREEAMRLKERLQRLPNVREVVFGNISPALGAHTGPGLIGVCFYQV